MSEVRFGPGTITIGGAAVDGGVDFSCEVMGGKIQHSYESVGAARTPLCGTPKPAGRRREDSVTLQLENDLTSEGVYAYCLSLGEDPAPKEIEFTPNTADGASWSGTVVPLLPGDIGADEYGAALTSSVTWPAVGLLQFTPAAGGA